MKFSSVLLVALLAVSAIAAVHRQKAPQAFALADIKFPAGSTIESVSKAVHAKIDFSDVESIEVRSAMSRYIEKIEMAHMYATGHGANAQTILRRGALDLLLVTFASGSKGIVGEEQHAPLRHAAVECLRTKGGFAAEIPTHFVGLPGPTATASWHTAGRTWILGACGHEHGGLVLVIVQGFARALVRHVANPDVAFTGEDYDAEYIESWLAKWVTLGVSQSFFKKDCTWIPPFTGEPSEPVEETHDTEWTATGTSGEPKRKFHVPA